MPLMRVQRRAWGHRRADCQRAVRGFPRNSSPGVAGFRFGEPAAEPPVEQSLGLVVAGVHHFPAELFRELASLCEAVELINTIQFRVVRVLADYDVGGVRGGHGCSPLVFRA